MSWNIYDSGIKDCKHQDASADIAIVTVLSDIQCIC